MYYFPIMSLAPIYFDRNRGFAMGVILAGSGVGGLVIAPVLQILLEKYGIQWSLRILAIWNLAIGLPVSSVIKHRPGFGFHTHVPGQTRARQSSSRINMGLLRRGTFWYQVCPFHFGCLKGTERNPVLGCLSSSSRERHTNVLHDFVCNLHAGIFQTGRQFAARHKQWSQQRFSCSYGAPG